MADRTVIEWDKDDIDALGILKVDVLALGMLTCMRKGFDLLAARTMARSATLGHHPGGGHGRLRHDVQGRHAWACSRSKAGRRCPCCRA